MVILRRLPDWDYNPRSIDGLDYQDCWKVPALPDYEGVRSYICTYCLKGVSEVVLTVAKRHTAVLALALAIAITVVR
jgi:hypothetical protein